MYAVQQFSRCCFLIVFVFVLSGCSRVLVHRPLEREIYEKIDVNDAGPPYRWWGDVAPSDATFLRLSGMMDDQPSDDVQKGAISTFNFLAISGGGANGAFGVGILAGWTESGQRPEFDVVTGASTGAIIAPFAFLGPDYDEVMWEIYYKTRRNDIFKPKFLSGLFGGAALTDTDSLKKQIDHYVDAELVEEIAVEYKKGRNLFIVTTHFDALRPMIWDVGRISVTQGEHAVDLIRQVILASSAIPVLFPPVLIEQEHHGELFTEMHVDAAVSRNVYAYPVQIKLGDIDNRLGVHTKRRIFVLQNANSELGYGPVRAEVLKMAERALKGLLQKKGNADIERIYYLAQRDQFDFNMIEIPPEFVADGATDFDGEYMAELLQLGYDIGIQGGFWFEKPVSER